MTAMLAALRRSGALSLIVLCAHCAGNQPAGAAAPLATSGGGSTTSSSDPQNTGPGAVQGTGDPNAASNPVTSNTNDTSATDPNAADPNAALATQGVGCNGMPGPCSTTLTAIALTGCAAGDYKAKVTMGGNQTFDLVIDTGSTVVAIADSGCTDCQGVTPAYTLGSGAQDLATPEQASYGTGNGWTGSAANDSVQISSGIKPLNLRFARITKQLATSDGQGFFTGSDCAGNTSNNADQGIFGMGNAAIALPDTDTYLDVLKDSNQVGDAFAFEACDNGGRLWFGGYDPNSISAAPVFTPLDTSSGYDLVTLSGITIGATQVQLSAQDFGKTLVDTGTSIFLLPSAAFDTLTTSIEADPNYGAVLPKGFLSSSQFLSNSKTQAQIDAQLPAMHLSFPGVGGQAAITVDLPASESYLTPYTYKGQSGYISGISPVSGQSPTTVLGNSTMHSHVMIFDRANSQLGYAPHTTCP